MKIIKNIMTIICLSMLIGLNYNSESSEFNFFSDSNAFSQSVTCFGVYQSPSWYAVDFNFVKCYGCVEVRGRNLQAQGACSDGGSPGPVIAY